MKWFHAAAAVVLALGSLHACSSEDDDGCSDISGTWKVQNQCIGGEETCTATQSGCTAQWSCGTSGAVTISVSGRSLSLHPDESTSCSGSLSGEVIDGSCTTGDGTCSWTATRIGGGGGSSSGPLDWYTSDCAQLGGTLTAAGACYIPCGTSSDCPLDDLSCASGYQLMCQVSGCSSDSDCGPQGWVCESWGSCYMRCTTSTDGAQSAECPQGWSCGTDPMNDAPHCIGKVSSGGGSCGVPCPEGCCSPSGLTCCQPPFCAGDCVGSPCCD